MTTTLERPTAVGSLLAAERCDVDELHRRYHKTRDRAACEALVARYRPLADQLARRYRQRGEPFDDLVQVAQVGLLNALLRFDPARGFAFRTFAVPTILGELRRHRRNTAWQVHMPRGLQERFLQVERATAKLTPELGRAPTPRDLAVHMELSEEEVLEALTARRGFESTSLDSPAGTPDEESGTLADTVGAEDTRFETVEDIAVIQRAMDGLSERDQHILLLRFVEDLTQSEIAARVGLSQMQISRILRRSVERLRAVADATP